MWKKKPMTSITGDGFRRRGLTLIEMMVVMAIIVIVASLVVVAATDLWPFGQKRGTEGVIEYLKAALHNYANENGGWFPPDAQGPVFPLQDIAPWSAYALDERKNEHGILNMMAALDSGGFLDNLPSDRREPVTVPEFGADRELYYVTDAYGRRIFYDTSYDAREDQLIAAGDLAEADRRDAKYYTHDAAGHPDFRVIRVIGEGALLYSLGENGLPDYQTDLDSSQDSDDIRGYEEIE